MLRGGWVAAEYGFPRPALTIPSFIPRLLLLSNSTGMSVCVFGGEAMAGKLVPGSLFHHCILGLGCVVLCSLPGAFLLSLSNLKAALEEDT